MTTGNDTKAMVRVHLPLALRPEAGGASALDVECGDVVDALRALFARHPTLRRHILDESGSLRPHVNVFVNDTDVRAGDGLVTAVGTGDEIHIVPSIAGG